MKKALFFLLLLSILYPANALYLLAVGNHTGMKIKFTVKTINSTDAQTDVFVASKGFIGEDTKLSIELAKDVVCSIFDCKGKDFLIKIYGDTPLLSGPSGGSAFATGMVMALLNLPDKNVGITGTINAGGVIGPVGGVNYKVEAARDLDLVIIPMGEKIYRDPLTNKTYNLSFPNVKEAGTLFDILGLVWGINISVSNKNFRVPEWYNKTMKKLAEYFCSKVNLKVKDNVPYYAQASYCFSKLIDLYKKNYENYNIKEAVREVSKFEDELKKLKNEIKIKFSKINGLNELQLYMILYKRLNDAEDNIKLLKELINKIESGQYKNADIETLISTLAYTKARILSIKKWLIFYDVMPKGSKIDYQTLYKVCEKNYKNARMYYDYLQSLYLSYGFPFKFTYLEKLYNKSSYYFKHDPILCIAYSKELKSNVDSILSLTYLTKDSLPRFFNSSSKITEFYIERNKEFPVMAYAYWNYAKFLAGKKDYISAINYNYLAINLATMIYEINGLEKKVKIIIPEKFDYSYLIFTFTLFAFTVYFAIVFKSLIL